MKPDPKKVEVIAKMAKSLNKTELQTILGMANFLAKFAAHLSFVTAPVRDLLKKDLQQETAFTKMRGIVTRSPVLAFYDPKKELTLQFDASEKATSATLMQEDRPIEYMSRVLDESKQNWATIERELLAIVYGCERFHQCMYGRKTTDHKPLETITRKPISSTPKRLQRMILELCKDTDQHRPQTPNRLKMKSRTKRMSLFIT